MELTPSTNTKMSHFASLSLVIVVVFLVFLFYFWNALLPFTLGVVLAFLLDPIVVQMERLRIPRTLGILVISFSCIALFVFLMGYVLPTTISGIITSVKALVIKLQNNQQLMQSLADFLQKYKLHLEPQNLLSFIMDKINPLVGHAVDYSVGIIQYLFQSLKIWVLALLTLVYLLLDKRAILTSISRLVPSQQKKIVLSLYTNIVEQIYQFILSLLIISVIVFIVTLIFLQFFNDGPSPFTLALGSGILSMIPFLGGILPPIFVFIVQVIYSTSLKTILIVLIIEIILYSFIGLYLQPMMTGRKVKIHPLIILVCIIIGGGLSGVFGVLLSVPTYIVIRTLFSFFLEKYRKEEVDGGK